MSTEATRKDWVGRVVDARFRLLEWLGSSGESDVFLCELDGDREQKAAIKLFPADAETAQSCESDWAAAAGLFHPHLVRAFHTGRDRVENTEVLYVVTEYAGEILSEILPERPLTPAEVKEMLGPTLDALAFLHEKGFVHCRLKPSNIMVVDDQLKLSVENIRRPSAMTKPPDTLDIYDGPERALGKASPASDIWSLGVTLVEALTQIPPVWNRSSTNDPMVPLAVPAQFKQIAQECLRIDPGLRCTLGEIERCLQTEAPIPHRTAKKVLKPSRKRPVVILAACAVVLLAVFAVLMVRSHQTAPSSPVVAQPPDTSTPAPQQTAPQPVTSGSQQAEAPALATAPKQNSVPVSQGPPAQTPPQTVPGSDVQVPAVKGEVAHQVMPDVPEKAMRTIQGTVQVSIQLNVDANGTVSDASIASQGPSRYFANLALEAAKSWKFTPAKVNGQGVASVWLLKFAFHQSGVDVTSAEKSP
jgi:TonB family protein